MTMPITHQDFSAVDDEPPMRPATAMSDASVAFSDHSQSSADIDPFALEHASDDYPGPATLDSDAARGMGGWYATRGRTLLPNEQWPNFTPTAAAQAGAYPAGRPPRVGEDGFPGPGATIMPAGARQHDRGSGSTGSGGAPGPVTSGRGYVEVPDALPPSLAALSAGASNEEMAKELERLLEGFSGTLAAASGIFGSSPAGFRSRGAERLSRESVRSGGSAGGSVGTGSGTAGSGDTDGDGA